MHIEKEALLEVTVRKMQTVSIIKNRNSSQYVVCVCINSHVCACMCVCLSAYLSVCLHVCMYDIVACVRTQV